MGDEDRPAKVNKVDQNHQLIITGINNTTQDHYCKIVISPDHLNPQGFTKHGIVINLNEFNKGCKVLGERCSYRLLTPLSTYRYAQYLHKATEDYLRNGGDDGPALPVIAVFNQSPFRFGKRSFVACSSSDGEKVFELLTGQETFAGFAREVSRDDPPFILNWTGPPVKSMMVDDQECLAALVKMIQAFDELQPNILGLGVCVLAEFGRFMLYDILVDGENLIDDDDEDLLGDDFRGYKQMLLVLQSQQVETGKSFLSEVLVRMFHGKKQGIHSTLSFDSAKFLLGRGEFVVIDDYNNDEIGCTLLSRSSKAIWGKSQITLRNQVITPKASILICTNEDITNLRVEGRNKDEVYMKLSVIDLGEEPMSSKTANKGEKFKLILDLTKVIRKYLPSYYGLMLSVCRDYISAEEFKLYENITKHERLGNLLKNVKNFYIKLNSFCELQQIVKPISLDSELDTSCLTNKSELVLKFKTPDQVVQILMSENSEIAVTEHEDVQGIAFDSTCLKKFPWYRKSLNIVRNEIKAYTKMRTRQLSSNKEASRAMFLRLDFLKEDSIEKLTAYIERRASENRVDLHEDPVEVIRNFYVSEIAEHERLRRERFQLADQFINNLINDEFESETVIQVFKCTSCGLITKSKGGLTKHFKKCKKK